MSEVSVNSSFQRASALSQVAKSLFLANPNNVKPELMDIGHPEVLNFLKELHLNKVRYLLVGGMATTFHGYIRTTQDLDLWVGNSVDNKMRLIQALKNSGVTGAEHFESVPAIAGCSSTITIGDYGFVADFMSDLQNFPAKDFEDCYERAKQGVFEGVPITVIHLNDLILEKRAAGRPKDLDDLEYLEQIKKESNEPGD